MCKCFISRKNVFIAVSVVCLVSYLTLNFSTRSLSQIRYVGHTLGELKFSPSLNCMEERFLSNSSRTCVIPQTPVMPEYFKTRWGIKVESTRNKYDCTYEKNIMEFKDETIVLLPEFTHKNCCLHDILRGAKDSKYDIKDCKEINENETAPEAEVFAVCCGNSFNMDASIRLKATVQKKMDHWKNIPVDERPMSVLLFGFDSVSRKHAYRSLPKSIETMKKFGFVDFQSYHSVQSSTLSNFMAFLMGLERSHVRLTCAKDWNSHFDSCPLIWKDFHAHNYVTTYVEDGVQTQTFNWGGQSGFMKAPTDYYIHHLFLALEKMRKSQIQKLKLIPKHNRSNFNEACVSTEKVPEFVLRYTQRFIQKFAEVPFFAFTWLNYPFHADMYALQNYDVTFERFLQSIMSNPNLSKRTMIIFLSDHGDRKSFYESDSYESFIERGLPPLFIRLPDMLTSKFPHVSETLEKNSKLLVSPFDVHHTLLHVLSIFPGSGPHLTKQNALHSLNNNLQFNSSLKDRSSLLTQLTDNRTCSDVNIPAVRCLCNLEYKNKEEDFIGDNKSLSKVHNDNHTRNPDSRPTTLFKMDNNILDSFLKFSISQLNLKVQMTKYKDACQLWIASSIKNITVKRTLFQSEGFIQVLFGFKANPEKAKFEGVLRVPLHPNYGIKADQFKC